MLIEDAFNYNLPIKPRADLRPYGSVNKEFLLARGWTRTAIYRVLGAPDRRLRQWNFPRSRSECRYDVERVIAAEDANGGPVRYRPAKESNHKQSEEWDRKPGMDREPRRIGTIKSYCRYCNRWFTYLRVTGRPRKYCSTRCRNRVASFHQGRRSS